MSFMKTISATQNNATHVRGKLEISNRHFDEAYDD